MTRDLNASLTRWLESGAQQIGQVRIERVPEGFELRHFAEVGRSDLELHVRPEAAREISTYDTAGKFRPLRTAPNLRGGWRMLLPDVTAVRAALDHFYPAMLGVLRSHEAGDLQVTDLRETLARQTGMYAVTKKVTDEQALETVGSICRSYGGCLKTILWNIGSDLPVTTLPAAKFDPTVNQTGAPDVAIPMLCHELCNLLVAEIRTVVKAQAAPTPHGSH